jgi:hypothetical protein
MRAQPQQQAQSPVLAKVDQDFAKMREFTSNLGSAPEGHIGAIPGALGNIEALGRSVLSLGPSLAKVLPQQSIAANVLSRIPGNIADSTVLPTSAQTINEMFGEPKSEGQARARAFGAAFAPLGARAGALEGAARQAAQIDDLLSAKPPTTQQLKQMGGDQFEAFKGTAVPVTAEMRSAIHDPPGRAAVMKAVNDAEIRQEYRLANEMRALLDPDTRPDTISAGAADKISRSFRELGSAAMKSDNQTAGAGWFGRRGKVETALTDTPGVKDARATWARYERSSQIDEAIQRAQETARTPAGAGDIAQAIRREFGKITKDPDQMALFPKEEQEALRRVANGTLTANILQQLGKFSPVRNQLTRMIETIGGISGAGVTGDITGALPALGFAAFGEAGRVGSNFASTRAARLASELIRGGPSASNTIQNALQNARIVPGGSANIPSIDPRVLGALLLAGGASQVAQQ